LLADVGLLGMPNAGKSTLIRAISAARPKVADYPFTTLVPNLGVVRVQSHRSFVVADIPGLIEGAAEGAGLGIRFLKHLVRTRLLLHLVDMAQLDGSDPAEAVDTIEAELAKFSVTLADRERWLVLNKLDLLPEDEREQRCEELLEELGWDGPVYRISAISGEGREVLCQDIMRWIEERAALEAEDEEVRAREDELRRQMDEEASEAVLAYNERRRKKREGEETDDEDDDNGDVEVYYVR